MSKDKPKKISDKKVVAWVKSLDDKMLEKVLSDLSPIERNVFCLRHGIRDPKLPKDKEEALAYVAKELNRVKKNIRAIEQKAKCAL